MKRFLAAICSLMLIFSACSVPSADLPDTDAGSETAAAQLELPSAAITGEELASYRLIFDEDAEAKVQTAVQSLCAYLTETHGVTVPQYADTKMAAFPYEILIGETVRKESVQFIETLRQNDYGWQMIGDKLVIAGRTDETTYKAVKEFMSEIKNGSDPDVVYNGERAVTYGVYAVKSLTVAGGSIGDFCIAPTVDGMTDAERHIVQLYAENLAEAIRLACGYILPTEETAGKHRIVLQTETSMAYNASGIRFSDGDVYITGGSLEALHQAIGRFGAAFSNMRADAVDIPAEDVSEDFSERGESTAMSYNIWVGGTAKGKQELVLRTVLKTLPDTVGFQEASPAWMKYLTENLSPIYEYVGEGRDGGQNGEYSPVFYKRSLYTLADSGTKWLSDTPEAVSKVPASSLNRIFSYALLEKKDGSRIMVVNTHLEHTSSEARVKQAQVLADFLETVDGPVLLTGDFNAEEGTEEYNIITQTGLANAADTAEKRSYTETFTNFGSSEVVIDFIFAAGLSVRVHEIHDDLWKGEYPSDHNPVVIRYTVAVSD